MNKQHIKNFSVQEAQMYLGRVARECARQKQRKGYIPEEYRIKLQKAQDRYNHEKKILHTS